MDLCFSVSRFALPSLHEPTPPPAGAPVCVWISVAFAYATWFKKWSQMHLCGIVSFLLLVQHLRTNCYLKILTLSWLRGSVTALTWMAICFSVLIFSMVMRNSFERSCSWSHSWEIMERWILGINLPEACWVSCSSDLIFLCFTSFLRQRKTIISTYYIICVKKKGIEHNFFNVLCSIAGNCFHVVSRQNEGI